MHGDYRLDNVLTDADDRLAAVIDWEMATLGDPLTDLALLVALPAARASSPTAGRSPTPPRRPASSTKHEIIERYAAAQRA